MSSTEERNKLESFQQLTGCDQNTAQALLEAANWDLELASTLFFDNAPQEPITYHHEPQPPSLQAAPQPTRTSTKPQQKRTGGIRTLSDFNSNDSDEESDDDSHNTYYAGGEKSGIQVKRQKQMTWLARLLSRLRNLE
eukprot:TRINITY_DN1655_c1_g1_i2.p1 TRINITY_DN1655_c1_g1~~TRINITY_DN1655_c1_g1_i2.p1  ORF type:complete len:138 (-),score=37.61 TRINITY_DN1655_c1_g1_i2:694-1107(-)